MMRHSLGEDRWEKMPDLWVARRDASACSLGSIVYVLCGYNEENKMLNSIECLDSKRLDLGWDIIDEPPMQSLLTPRVRPAVVPLGNCSEIAILGGRSGYYNQKDVLAFNTETEDVKVLANQGEWKFEAAGNQAALVSLDTVVALVAWKDNPTLVKFVRGSDAVKRVEVFD